jgi:hypothetical protein
MNLWPNTALRANAIHAFGYTLRIAVVRKLPVTRLFWQTRTTKLKDVMRHLTSPNWKFAGLCLFLDALMVLASGCVMSDQAESDYRWQQMNPDYKPTAPPDGRPQWGFFSAPDH